MQTKRGLFITLEGGEGTGKTTQIARLKAWAEAQGKDVLATREPGGTLGAETIRTLVVEGKSGRWDAVSETLLFLAARRDHVERHIRPALKEGKWVLCDRFSDSTLVYQGIGKGLGMEYVETLQRLAIGTLTPDLTFILDIDVKEGLKRAAARKDKETRFEELDTVFHENVRQGFLSLARTSSHYHVIEAGQSIDTVHEDIVKALACRM